MQIQVDIGFQELLEVVKKLPENQLMLLKKELEKKPIKSRTDSFREFLLNGPTLSDEQIHTMEETRNAINKWREI